MRDIRGDLQDRAGYLEEQIGAAQAQFEKHMEQVTLEHQARIDDLRAELDAVMTLMEGEYRRLTVDAGGEERRGPAPQPARQAEPERQRPMAPEPQARAEPEVPHRYEPEPHAVAAEAEPARAQSPGERHDRHPAEPAYGRPQPSEETGAQHRPDAVGDVEREPRTPAPQIYRRAPLAGDRGHQPAPAAAQQQAPQAQPQPQPQARSQQPQPQRPPLADFLIRKLSEAGAMALEDLCQFAVRDGYFAEDDNPERSVQVTLMNVAKAGFIRQLPNGTFAPATVMDTIRLRRAI